MDEYEKLVKHMRWQMFAIGVIVGLILAGLMADIAAWVN